jgi:hypothetical protein
MTTGEFWADKVQRLKKTGRSAELIEECRKNIPYPAAFEEIAVALRKNIRTTRKDGGDTSSLLSELHRWAVVEGFFSRLPWTGVMSERLLHSTARSCIVGLATDYDSIGYEHLRMLKVTDVRWLIEAFGEPKQHRTAREANPELWDRARLAFATVSHQSGVEVRYDGSTGPGLPGNPAAEASRPTSTRGSGCAAVLAAVVVVLVSWAVAIALSSN